MKDIISITNGEDLKVDSSIVPKAANLLSIQIGYLIYEPEFGIDLQFFLDNTIRFQTESFKAYLVQRLSQNFINVTEVSELIDTLSAQFNFNLDEDPEYTGFVI